jgi:hypothetical protein
VEQVMYIDKRLREHNLLQAIARVNRVTRNKHRGFIVDYIGPRPTSSSDRGAPPRQEAEQGQDEENEEGDPSKTGRRPREATESEDRGDDRHDEEHNSRVQHGCPRFYLDVWQVRIDRSMRPATPP